jgi:hypothetical protein
MHGGFSQPVLKLLDGLDVVANRGLGESFQLKIRDKLVAQQRHRTPPVNMDKNAGKPLTDVSLMPVNSSQEVIYLFVNGKKKTKSNLRKDFTAA